MSWALLISVPVTIVGALAARPIVAALTGSVTGSCDRHAELVVGTRMLLVFMPQVVLYAVGVVATGVLQAHRRFLGPAVAPLLSSMVVIGAYVLFDAMDAGVDLSRLSLRAELVLSLGTTLGVAALALPLLWPVSRLGLRWRPTLRFPHAIGRRVAGLALAGALTLAAQQLSVAVVVRLANGGASGTLVLYNLAWTVFLVPWAVVSVPVAISAFPRLSARADAGDLTAYGAATAAGLRVVLLVTAAAVAAIAAAAEPIARLLAFRVPGNADTTALALALGLFAPGLLGYGLVAYLGRALYARTRWRFAAAAICLGWLVVIVADLALVPAFAARWRVVALAIGNTAGMTVAGVALLVGVARTSGGSALAGIHRTVPGAIAGAVVGFGLGMAVATAVGPRSALGSVWVAGLAGAVAAAGCLAVGVACEPAAERRRLVDLVRRMALRGGGAIG
jgi:putative peptidoglycan lipid II flippase